ncbi:helix-turn-helix domain-containing protein [Hymenobacter sp. 5516J-16]|uniref:helix-turn-helix domain-containing protein n=1 Tax=Hymenobacter sp. 5516J-16 TaxID=2932253 RepID=UPI0039793536
MIEQRIRELLATRQLTPTQLADTIGISRPIVSHILSGRNKPSLEVVQKIIAAFPELSLPWLLSGTGPMTASAPSPAPEAPRVRPAKGQVERVPASRPEDAVKATKPVDAAPVVSVPVPAAPEETPPSPPVVSAQPVTTPGLREQNPSALPSSSNTSEMLLGNVGKEKSIRRIVIFYQDGTFADFQPESPAR